MDCLQLSVASSRLLGFTSDRASQTPSLLAPRTRAFSSGCTLFGCCCCPRLEDVTLHGDCQLFQRLQSILRGRVVDISVPAAERSTTDDVVRSTYQPRPRHAFHHDLTSRDHQVARSNSLRYHVDVDRTDDTFFSSLEMIRTRGLHMRTFSQSASTRLLSSLQCYKSTQRQVSVSSIVRDSTRSESRYRSSPTSNHAYLRPVSCHVSRCINTNSDPLLHTSYREACPTTRSTHVAMHVISHNDTAQSEGDPHCP